MAPTHLHLIRHAQGFHNISTANHALRDPLLTPLGESQCHTLSTTLPSISTIDLIVASPIKRALYTALLTFRAHLTANPTLRIIALPDLQETSNLPCDTGSDLAELQREFANMPIDFSHMTPGWNNKTTGPYAPVARHVMARARRSRRWIAAREEKEVAVVTHGGFLHYFTEDWSDHAKFTGTGWANTEFRSYTFDMSTPQNVENATVVETPESRLRRKGHEISLTEAEQVNLMETAQRTWEEAGYIMPFVEQAEDGYFAEAEAKPRGAVVKVET